MNIFYVYCYKHPKTLEPFYIGKGKHNRAYYHLSKALKSEKDNKSLCITECQKIIKDINLYPIIEFVGCSLSEKDAFTIEEKNIKIIGRKDLNKGPLLNITNGGEGESNRIHSKETKLKISSKLKNVPLSEERKQNMRKPKSWETLEEKEIWKQKRKSIANRPDFKKKISEFFKNKPLSIEQKQKISNTIKQKIITKEISIEHLRKSGKENPMSKKYVLKTPQNTEIEIISLNEFCLKNNINSSSLRNTYRKKKPLMRGINAGWQILKIISI